MLGCQSRTKTLAYRPPILLPHQLQYLLPKFRFMSMVRGPTHTAMLQPCGAPLPISLPQSLRLPVAHLQELAGIYNPQMLAPHTRQHFHPSQLPLAHLCPPQSDLLSEVLLRGHFYFGEKGTLLSWNNTSCASFLACNSVRPASKPFQAPGVLRLNVLQHISVAVHDSHPEVGLARRIPLVLYLDNFQRLLAKLQAHRPFVRLIPRIALHL